MHVFSKKELIKKLRHISEAGWIKNRRKGNQGGIGNTLEDLLGIEENNLPIPNAAEWELKTQRKSTSALITLFHMEPSPRALKFVPKILLPKYGWKHQKAGTKYPDSEMSFRQTIHGKNYSDRGFIVNIDQKNKKIFISFHPKKVDKKHFQWLEEVKKRTGLKELSPHPYWGFDDLKHKAGTKLPNTFYVQADVKKDYKTKEEYYHYNKVLMLRGFNFESFLHYLEQGYILVDFDARTGHNHGTKFRIRQSHFPFLYKKVKRLI